MMSKKIRALMYIDQSLTWLRELLLSLSSTVRVVINETKSLYRTGFGFAKETGERERMRERARMRERKLGALGFWMISLGPRQIEF